MSPRSLALLGTLFHLLSLVSCINRWPNPQGMVVVEEKIRLGSTPPSCHNRCDACDPCTAVQVPTLPGGRAGPADNRYSDYKPLGWKCRCRDRLFNP